MLSPEQEQNIDHYFDEGTSFEPPIYLPLNSLSAESHDMFPVSQEPVYIYVGKDKFCKVVIHDEMSQCYFCSEKAEELYDLTKRAMKAVLENLEQDQDYGLFVEIDWEYSTELKEFVVTHFTIFDPHDNEYEFITRMTWAIDIDHAIELFEKDIKKVELESKEENSNA